MTTAPDSIKLLGIGNPLLDISAEVKEDLLKKYDLKPSNAILAEEKHMPLYTELVQKYDVTYVPGGSCLNSMRIAQWLLKTPQAVGYLGTDIISLSSIGKDSYAEILKKEVAADQIFANFHIDESVPTGTCAALITNHERSLVANLSAANNYKEESVNTALSKSMMANAQILYATSFFLTVSPESAHALAKHAAEHNKPFAMNLSAPFLLEVPVFLERVMSLVPYMDYVFCNNHEADALIKSQGWTEGDQKAAAEKLAKMDKVNKKRERVVVFTQGAKPAIVYREGKIHEYPVIPLKDGQMVDENGAGDAYLGGFLAGLASGKSFDESIYLGGYAAYLIIQQHGCAIPKSMPKVQHKGFTFGTD